MIVVLVVYLVVRQIEDQIIMPLVIGRVVHLHPVVTIFAVLVGLSVWGVLGGLLGVPLPRAERDSARALPRRNRAQAEGDGRHAIPGRLTIRRKKHRTGQCEPAGDFLPAQPAGES